MDQQDPKNATDDPEAGVATTRIPPGPLAGIVRRGALISAITLAFTTLVSVVSTIWLARLLSPAEVGIYTAATVLIAFLIQSAEGGLRLALVQRERDVEDAADVVFWATAGIGLLCSLVALASAPVLGYLFHSELVVSVALSTAALVLMESLTQVPDGLMQRRFNFLRRLVVDPARALAFAIVSIVAAASGFGVWSMVMGQYAAVGVWLISSWSLARWRPGRGRPTMRLWRELARFAYPLVISNIAEYIRSTVVMTVTGRRLGEVALGNYRYGLRLGTLPGLAVFEIGSYVLFPAFSRLANDTERMHAAFMRALRWIWLAATPVAALMIALGEQAVVVVLGEPWRDAGLLVVGLAGVGLGGALEGVASEVIKAAGRSALLHWTSAIAVVLGIGLVVALLPLGLFGVGVATSVTNLIIGIVLLAQTKSIVGFRFAAMARILVPPILAAGVSFAAAVLLGGVLGAPDTMPTGAGLGVLVVLALTLILTYLAIMAVVERKRLLGALARR